MINLDPECEVVQLMERVLEGSIKQEVIKKSHLIMCDQCKLFNKNCSPKKEEV